MNYKLLLTFLFCAFGSIIIAQSNYKKGYVINRSGDTLTGFINYKEWSKNPEKFEFKSSDVQTNISYITTSNASKVVIIDHAQYAAFIVSASMDEVDLNKLELEVLPNKVDTVFLKVISSGSKVNLYHFRDELKDRFYVLSKSEVIPVELEYKVQRKGDQLLPVENYKLQLLRVALSSSEYKVQTKDLIENATYSRASLKKIVDVINNDKEIDNGSIKFKKTRWVVSAGINNSSITYRGSNVINANGLDNNGNPTSKEKTTTRSFLPALHIAHDLFFKPAIKSSFIRFETSITAVQSKTTSLHKFAAPNDEELTNKFDLFGCFVSFTPQYIINVLQHSNLNLYAGGGVSLRYAFYPKQTLYQNTSKTGPGYSNKVYEDYFNMRSMDLRPSVSIGSVLNKKFAASLMWYPQAELTTTDKTSVISVKETGLLLNFGYFF